ncbi:MAG: hypothetical protein AB7I04_18465 [Pseudomonadales bacterium]
MAQLDYENDAKAEAYYEPIRRNPAMVAPGANSTAEPGPIVEAMRLVSTLQQELRDAFSVLATKIEPVIGALPSPAPETVGREPRSAMEAGLREIADRQRSLLEWIRLTGEAVQL